jgi:hypothetical protein
VSNIYEQPDVVKVEERVTWNIHLTEVEIEHINELVEKRQELEIEHDTIYTRILAQVQQALGNG